MTKTKSLRFDPLYRAIETPDELQVIEGSFQALFKRLETINNLGIIPEVLRMAKYSKYEHHIGTIYQLQELLRLTPTDVIPNEYRMPLKLAAIFLHVGHLPFTYSTERALLIASNLGDRGSKNPIRKAVEKRLVKVLKTANSSEDKMNAMVNSIFSLRDHTHLYRFFSAEELINSWPKLKTKISGLDDEALITAVQDLALPDSEGYQYLELADKADFVQRDALYFGTIKLDVSPKHLYEDLSKYQSPYATSEAELIETSLEYLSERFYNDSRVIWYTRLYEKIVALLMTSKAFKQDWPRKYSDEELKRLMCSRFNQKNEKVRLPPTWCERARQLFNGEISFSEKFRLKGLSFPKDKDVIDIEYQLVGKRPTQKGLLTYPFETGILLSVNYLDASDRPVKSADNLFSTIVFQDDSNQKLVELLKIVSRLSGYLSATHIHAIRNGVGRDLSWTGGVRFDEVSVNRAIVGAIRSIESGDDYEEGEFVESAINQIASIKTYDELWDNYENEFLWRFLIPQYLNRHPDEINRDEVYEWFVDGLLSLPARLLQFQSTSNYLNELYDHLLLALRSSIPNDQKGGVFEALWLIERLRSKEEEQFQFFLNGLVVVDLDKPRRDRDQNEFDVIELSINTLGKAECKIFACSIGGDYIRKNREQLGRLAHHIHRTYADAVIRTFYVVPTDKDKGDWSPKLEQAGISYS